MAMRGREREAAREGGRERENEKKKKADRKKAAISLTIKQHLSSRG